MGLTNSQYDQIMRHYSQLQTENRHRLEEHRKTAYEAIPELSELDEQLASTGVRTARLLMEDPSAGLSDYRQQSIQIAGLRKQLLIQHGFPEDYLSAICSCPDCQDTGYIDGRKCHCFLRQAIDLFYTQSGMADILKAENFSHFSYDYYPEDMINPVTGRSSREQMRGNVSVCLDFIRRFDTHEQNLFLYGGTGLGKTFLSHCIAKELIDRSHSVVYFSAYELFELLAENTFGQDKKETSSTEYIMDSDLLIIDDLGTELTNAFVASQLFQILNERILKRKSVIISTNLSLDRFADLYSERVFSRITSHFTLLSLFGNDIRIQKKLHRSERSPEP